LSGEDEAVSSLLWRAEKVAAVTFCCALPPEEIFGRGCGGFLPGRVRGLMPGDLSERPGQRRSALRRLTVSPPVEQRGSISTDFSQR
jgi:hypothetical protein